MRTDKGKPGVALWSRRRMVGGVFGGGAILAAAAFAGGAALTPAPAAAKSRAEINVGVQDALNTLFSTRPGARDLYNRASGVLVIPEVIKAGLILGGAYGEGALLTGGGTDSYWSYAAASIGYQLGAQRTSQVLFFMTPEALQQFQNSNGFEVGADAEVTLIDSGAEVAVDTTKDTKPILAIVFGREGLLAGASLQGGKYSRINP